MAGDPDEVVEHLQHMMEETGTFASLIMVAHDWDDKDARVRNIELFAHEVMPKLNKT